MGCLGERSNVICPVIRGQIREVAHVSEKAVRPSLGPGRTGVQFGARVGAKRRGGG